MLVRRRKLEHFYFGAFPMNAKARMTFEDAINLINRQHWLLDDGLMIRVHCSADDNKALKELHKNLSDTVYHARREAYQRGHEEGMAKASRLTGP